jgi:hypothetical protein
MRSYATWAGRAGPEDCPGKRIPSKIREGNVRHPVFKACVRICDGRGMAFTPASATPPGCPTAPPADGHTHSFDEKGWRH